MTSPKAERTWSNLPVPPGEVLSEEIEALGMSQKDLASALDRPVQVVNEIINAKKGITQETALGLERVLGIGAHVWVGLESTYRMTIARNRELEQLRASQALLTELPINAMAKLDWVSKVRDKEEQVREVLRFFGVANVSAYRRRMPIVGFRFTEKATVSEGALAAWLRKGETEARIMETRDFNTSRLYEAAVEARALTSTGPDVFVPRLKLLFANAGVAFVIVPELPKTGANGVARWLTSSKALIQLNLRYKWADIFWFTLFHEVGHLLKHSKGRGIIVDGKGISGDPTIEDEADRWRADFLINPDTWRTFVSAAGFTRDAIKRFAAEAGVAPGIVVGRLHREGLLPYSQLADPERAVRVGGSMPRKSSHRNPPIPQAA